MVVQDRVGKIGRLRGRVVLAVCFYGTRANAVHEVVIWYKVQNALQYALKTKECTKLYRAGGGGCSE